MKQDPVPRISDSTESDERNAESEDSCSNNVINYNSDLTESGKGSEISDSSSINIANVTVSQILLGTTLSLKVESESDS